MEEILASIRRIISDGDEGAAAPAAAVADEPEPEDIPEMAEEVAEEPAEELAASADADADIFDLTDDMVSEEPEVAESPEPAVEEEPEDDEPAAAEVEAEEPSASEDIDMDDIDKIMAGEMAKDDDFDTIAENTVVDDMVEAEKLDVDFGDTAEEPVEEPEPAPEPIEPEAIEPEAKAPEPEEPEPEELEPEEPEVADPEPVVSETPEPKSRPTSISGLLSPQSDAVVASAFDRLANTILTQDPRTLEDLVGDMLRPMLKDWLDDNLPGLVEKLVREEIERVSRGRR
jgi:hypothetical protein